MWLLMIQDELMKKIGRCLLEEEEEDQWKVLVSVRRRIELELMKLQMVSKRRERERDDIRDGRSLTLQRLRS